MSGKIFIIEDEPSIIQLVQHNLEKEGFIVSSSTNGNNGLKELKKFEPHLLLLDWMLPDLSGVEICKNIRKDIKLKSLPIIMLTAKGEEEDKIKGLDSGVDDYLTKPFSFNELLARIKAVLRRSDPKIVSDYIEFDDLKLNRNERRVFRSDIEITLGPTEFRLLEFFLSHFKKVLLKLYWLLIFSLYKQRNIILVGNSCIFGKTVVFVLYFARSNSVFLKEKVVIFFLSISIKFPS